VGTSSHGRDQALLHLSRAPPLTDFNVRSAAPDGLQSRCRGCSRRWYVANRDTHRANVRRRSAATKREYKRRIGEHLRATPCVDCGESDVRVLDFDHLVGSDKRADIAAMVNAGGRWSDIELEIAKCAVRCANCHRRVTSDRAQDWQAILAAELLAAGAEGAQQRLTAVLSER
jgi:hypothetical protein